jgi:hypothetical protein
LSLAGSVVGVVGGVLAYLRRRWAKSAGRELQPFSSYVGGSLRLMVRLRLQPQLARRFGVRAYADVTFARFTNRMPIPSRGRSHLDIERAYIRLSLSASPEQRVDDESLLAARGSVLIFGEPGSGKSSLTRKLHREALKRASAQPLHSRLPLHFEFGKLPWGKLPAEPDERLTWLRDLLRGAVSRVTRVNRPDFVFDAFAQGPGLLLFLDGLDEVPADKAELVQSLVADLLDDLLFRSADTLVIVTARTQMRSVLGRRFVEGFNDVLTVAPFTPADVFAFLRRWDFPRDRRITEAHRIFEHLRNNATLADMCTNPLVLSMYVAEDEAQTESAGSAVRLADTRARFYDQVVGEFLFFRREEQRQQEQPVGMQLLVTRQELLGRIALDHLMNSTDPANVVSLRRAAETAGEYWRIDQPEKALAALEALAVDSGLVTVQVRGESLQFIHLSIAEYLAGRELAERSDDQLWAALARVVGDAADSRRLWETVVFAVALSKRDTREQAIRYLVDENAPPELIMRIIRELRTYDLPAFADVIGSATRRIHERPMAEWDAEWLAGVRLVLSCLGDAHRLTSVRTPAAVPTVPDWLADLVGNDGERFERVFDLYFAESPAEALRVAEEFGMQTPLLEDGERIVAAMEHPDVVALARRKVLENGDGGRIWIPILAEAALRFELVTQMLIEEETVPPALMALADEGGRRYGWHQVGPAAGTLYGVLLAIATSRTRPLGPEDEPRLVRRVEVLAMIRATNGAPVLANMLRGMAWLFARVPVLPLFDVAIDGVLADFRDADAVPRLLNLAEPLPDHTRFDVTVTRFGDGVVRLFAEPLVAEGVNQVRIDHIRDFLGTWFPCDADGRLLTGGTVFAPLTNRMGSLLVTQAGYVLRRGGPVWCEPRVLPVKRALWPPRRSRW